MKQQSFENDAALTGNFNDVSEEIVTPFFRVDKADIFSVERGGDCNLSKHVL